MRGAPARGSPTGRLTATRSAAATESTTLTSRSASSVLADAGLRVPTARAEPDERPRACLHLDAGFPQDRIQFPPFIDPTINLGGVPAGTHPDRLTLPRFQNWSVTYQRKLTDNMMLDVSYIGNRGTRLNHHQQSLGVDSNMNHPDVLALGSTLLQSNINSPAAQAAGIPIPYAGFNGNVAQALRQWPQYQQIDWRGVPTGNSQYHAVETVLERRFSRGLQARVGYTYSQLKNNGAETGQGSDGRNGGIQNPAAPLPWMLSDDDTPHVLLVGFCWEVPGPDVRRGQLVPGRLEPGGPPAIRERSPIDDHDEQRSRRPAVQHPEAAEQDR